MFVKAGGTVIRRDLAEGEELRISSGCLVCFSGGVDYGRFRLLRMLASPFSLSHQPTSSRTLSDVQMVKGFANVFAGGEGLFMTTLKGPGTVWLQGQPPQRMISEIARRVPSGGGIGLAVPVPGMGGGGGGGEGGGSDESSNQ